jgi:hypothetical protein
MALRKTRSGLHIPAFVPNGELIMINTQTPTTRWVTVTPEMAMKWLDETNTKNRPVRETWVARLAADMKAGRWRGQNGEAIRFDTSGRLVDGQHRLWACTQSGMPFDTLLITGVDEEDYGTIGIGRPKSFGDFLGPVHGEKNVYLLASMVRLVYRWQHGNLDSKGNVDPTIAELEITLRDHPGIRESANRVASMAQLKRILTSSFAGLIHYAGYLEGKTAMVESFLERLGSGLGLMDDDPVYHLRKFLLSQRGIRPGYRRPTQVYILALAIKAWTASKEEKRIKALQFRTGDAFPQL